MADIVDHANDLAAQQVEESLAAHRARLAADSARSAMSGTGRGCSGCGDAIDPRRLAAVPHARRCVRCQSIADRSPSLN